MPAVTAVAFDSLLQRGSAHSSSPSAPTTSHQYLTLQLLRRRDEGDDGRSEEGPPRRTKSASFSYYISSPALYTTPEPAQLAGSSAAMCVSPSPYVVNHKRREWPAAAASTAGDSVVALDLAAESNGDAQVADRLAERGRNNGVDSDQSAGGGVTPVTAGACNGRREDHVEKEADPTEEEVDDFFNPKGPADATDSETEEGSRSVSFRRGPDPNTPLLNQSEFYDAPEDFFSDSSGAHHPRHLELESDLRSLRLNLFEEIERRKKAEESLAHMDSEWRKMASCFSQVGLSFPPIPDGQDKDDEDPVSEVCQQIVITNLVSEAFQRELAWAEAEACAETVFETKNHEISRLYDRLQYYEAVNREMSQRNQEEKARQRRLKRRSRQRLLWGCVGLSITIGTSLLAYSYLSSPGTSNGSSEPASNSFDPSPAASDP